jgi:Holliday junction resolvasome RuvABC endonuclease subunit
MRKSKLFFKTIGMPNLIIAIDASTNSMAFSVYENEKLIKYGKIKFSGYDAYHKAGDACKKCLAFFKEFKVDAVVIESAIYANSPKTAMHLSLVQGAILGAAQFRGIKKIVSTSPVQWQNWIGNKRLTNEEKETIRAANPNKSGSWYKSQERLFRKQRTIRIVNDKFKIKIDDDDVGDAVALGWFAITNWNKLIGEPQNS